MTDPTPSAMTPIERPRSLTEIVTGQIRDLIVAGRLELGEQLSESTLAAQLGVSRTPVREAFLRLESERLVEISPQRGTFVFEFDAGKLRELCELREILETGALRVALARGRRVYIDRLAGEVGAGEAALRQNPEDYPQFDTAFHDAVVSGSGNIELMEAYGRISGRIRTIRQRLNRGQKQSEAAQRDHAEILHLLQSGADESGLKCLAAHVYNGYQVYLRELDAEQAPARGRRQKGGRKA